MRIALPRHLLGQRHDRLDLAQVDQHRTRVAALLDHAGDDVALHAGEVAVLLLVLDVPQPLHDHLPGGRGGHPPEAFRGAVVLADLVTLLVPLGHDHVDVAGLAVQFDPGPR